MMDFINSIEFARPLFMILLPVSLGLLAIVFWYQPKQLLSTSTPLQQVSQQSYRHPALDWFQQRQSQQQSQNHQRQFIVRILGWGILLGLLHLSLAQPYRLGERLPDPPQHRDIVFVIDTSVSMVLEDYIVKGKRVSRMAMLQSVMQHFIDQLQGNRIGLIVYSEQVYTLVPLTTDYDLLKQQFNRMQPAVLTGRTSNPGKALLYTLAQYQKSDNETKPTIVLVTDVNRPDRNIDPRIAAAKLHKDGFRLHTVAIGAGSYAAENKQGSSLVYHPTNYPLLKQIAEQARGEFFTASNSQQISQALLTIQQSEKRQVETEPQYIRLGFYQWPLLLALILLSLSQLIQLTRGRT
ncbi:MAG: VWA domain-containing protein [Gammaproteobacteria bacterium]|nr:VWA domain-containing protein [Gammaproteobacteria bacterium]